MASRNVSPTAMDGAVVVVVGELDKRAYVALRRGVELSDGRARAVHVSVSGEDVQAFALEWARTGGSLAVPLDIVESPDGLAPAIRAAIEPLLRDHAGTVTVVIGRLGLRRRWHRLLHDRSAEQIIEALGDLERVRIEPVDVPV